MGWGKCVVPWRDARGQSRRGEQNSEIMVIPKREGKCCDAVVRQLERAIGAGRTAVTDPELIGEEPPVDLRVTLGGRAYALEHTRVLPFADRIEVVGAYQDIRDCLDEWFDEPLLGDTFYQLHLPLGVTRPGRGRRGERRRQGLRHWIGSAVDELQARAPGRRGWSPGVYELDFVSGRPDGWDCEFTLGRSSDGILPPEKAGSLVLYIGGPDDPEPPFIEDLRRAFGSKCPKLADCKASDPDVQTVLVLEAVDLQLEHDRCIAKHLPELLAGCEVEPDHIFLVWPDVFLWSVWVVKRNGVQWPDERLLMPHKGYQDPPKLVPEDAYPKGFVEAFNRSVGAETPAQRLAPPAP